MALVEPYAALGTFVLHVLTFALTKDAVASEASEALVWARSTVNTAANLRPLVVLARLRDYAAKHAFLRRRQ